MVMPDTEGMLALSTQVTGESEQTRTADQELVKGLGLTSATALVMGSMIGSGVIIVAADIARQTDSPALLIGAWLVTGFMTVAAALSYGELAAMMPHAGGQYVYLRESPRPALGMAVRMDPVSGDPDRHDCRRWRGPSVNSSACSFRRSPPAIGFGTLRTCPRCPLDRWCWATWTSG